MTTSALGETSQPLAIAMAEQHMEHEVLQESPHFEANDGIPNLPPTIITPDQALAHKTVSSNATKQDYYTLPRCVMPPLSELQPIETFVMNAIQSKHNEAAAAVVTDPSHAQGYRAIIDGLKRPVDPPMLRMVLIALRTAGNGTALNLITTHSTIHAQLVHWLFRFNPTLRPKIPRDEESESLCAAYYDGSLLDAHLHLILAMVSARTVNLVPALTCVWKMLSENVELPESFQRRLHAMLSTMMRLVPKARSDLFPIIAARFPFWKAEKRVLKWYCVQSFQTLDYLPSIRKQLLELVIDKCLEIDVNIKIDENGQVSIEAQDKTNDDGQNENPQDESTLPQEVVPVQVDTLSDTLDSLLALLLRTLSEASSDGQGVRELYYEVLPVFESTIITTHKSKFVQYCMFLLCGLEAQRCLGAMQIPMASPHKNDTIVDPTSHEHSILHRDFASKLLGLIMDPYRAALTRQSAACYLASFVCRASYVEAETVCEAVSALLRWAEAYMDTLATNSIRAADARNQGELHALFYTVCQAAFYIMCFRGIEAIHFYREALLHCQLNQREPTDDGDESLLLPDPTDIDLGTSRWTNICNHDLQPLRFCLESVRSEFLHVAHAFELIEEPILDKLVVDAKRMSTGRVNKKAASTITTAATLEKQRRKGGVGGLGQGSNPLRSFFPFDPLLLRRSHALIEPFYKHWQGPVEEDDMLVIDEAPDDDADDHQLEMEDEELLGGGDDDSDDENEDDDDVPVIVSDHETKDDDSDTDNEEDSGTQDFQKKRQQQKEAWAATLKRPRSQSLENGSW